MKVHEKPPVHLTYCLNVHPGETWEENFASIRTMTLAVRDRVAPGKAFGLGLRLGHRAASRLASPDVLKGFKAFLEEQGLYVFTINGFPYGDFHGLPVKERVYHPDWRTGERRDYTIRLAEILSTLVPEGVSGSISTVPVSHRAWIKSEADRSAVVHNLTACVARLAEIREETGQDLHIGLEPEADCFLETTGETVAFFTRDLAGEGRRHLAGLTGRSEPEAGAMISRHLGVCLDTCHLSLQFEDLADSVLLLKERGIRLSKIQLSAALKVACTERNLERLKDFCDPIYLHQVKARTGAGDVASLGDLPAALNNRDGQKPDGREWRIHFHVPLYFVGDGEPRSTSGDLTPGFFKKAVTSGCDHLEIETYTFNLLPEDLRERGIVASVSEEYAWVLRKLGIGHPQGWEQ